MVQGQRDGQERISPALFPGFSRVCSAYRCLPVSILRRIREKRQEASSPGQSAGGGQSGGGDDLLFLCHPRSRETRRRSGLPVPAAVPEPGFRSGGGRSSRRSHRRGRRPWAGKRKRSAAGSAPDFPQAVQAQRFREAVQEKSGPPETRKGTGNSPVKKVSKAFFGCCLANRGGNEPGQSGLNAGDTDGEGQKIQGHGS